MARREDSDFLKRMFDEPAGGKSPKSRSGRRSRRSDRRARLLAVLEAAGERPQEPVVIDDALLAGYLDGALAREEQIALEGLLARSADLREQLAAAAQARAAALDGKARMPKAFIEDFDAVQAPSVGKPAGALDASRAGVLSRWLTALAPGRRWAMAALPAIVAVIVVAVIGPVVYGPEKSVSPKALVGGPVAARDMKKMPASRKHNFDFARKEKPPPSGAAAGMMRRKPQVGSTGTGESRRGGSKARVVASVVVPLDNDLRAALVRLGLRQNRLFSAARSVSGRTGSKREAATPPSPAPKQAGKIYAERKQREASPKAETQGQARRAYSVARKTDRRYRSLAVNKTIGKAVRKNCPVGAAMCCERRRVDAKLLRRLLAGGPPLQAMKVVHLSSKTCLLTLPATEAGR